MLRIPLLEPGSKDAHERREDRVDRANKADGIRLHDKKCPDGRDQVEDSPCGSEDAIRLYEDRVSQRRVSVVAVFGVMSGQRQVCEAGLRRLGRCSSASVLPRCNRWRDATILCRLLTLVVTVVVNGAGVCVRIGRGTAAVAPVFVSTGLSGCLSACMQGELGLSAVFL